MTLLTKINARAVLNYLLKFCWRQFLSSLNPRIIFLLLVRRQFSFMPKWGVTMSMTLATKSTSGRSIGLVKGLRTSTPRVFVLPFPSVFTRTRVFGTYWLAVVFVDVYPHEKWLVNNTSYFYQHAIAVQTSNWIFLRNKLILSLLSKVQNEDPWWINNL